jgi:hypothetical protein
VGSKSTSLKCCLLTGVDATLAKIARTCGKSNCKLHYRSSMFARVVLIIESFCHLGISPKRSSAASSGYVFILEWLGLVFLKSIDSYYVLGSPL